MTRMKRTVWIVGLLVLVGGCFAAGCRSNESDALEEAVPQLSEIPGAWIRIRAGRFMMGSPEGEEGRTLPLDHEIRHRVTLTRGFEIQTTEVTQRQFQEVMGYNPSWFSDGGAGSACGPNCSVEMVNWFEAAAYCNRLSERAGAGRCYTCSGSGREVTCDPNLEFATPYDCPGYRLPTEAEFEYAARSGITKARNGVLLDVAWVYANSSNRSHDVGTRDASPWGLYDMLGNVQEYCSDWYAIYPGGTVTDPWGPLEGESRVVRGGSWHDFASDVAAAHRRSGNISVPPTHTNDRGFRPARTLL